ncbi:MAG: hypothetical protein OEX98_03565 [Nitrosopumilus sp.]|nr:hypothetical protein [Nitrosopumilus sp.]
MTLKRHNLMAIMTIILTISLAALFVSPAVVAADNDDDDKNKDAKKNSGKTHLVEMKATALPNGS